MSEAIPAACGATGLVETFTGQGELGFGGGARNGRRRIFGRRGGRGFPAVIGAAGRSILLAGVDKSDLSPDDFLFT